MGIFDFFKKNNNINIGANSNVSIKTGSVECNEVFLNDIIRNELERKYISFDIETTGLDPVTDRIVEIGAVLFENKTRLNQFNTLINTGKQISEEAMRINNISNEMIGSSPLEIDVYPRFVDFLGQALSGEIIICAHNAKFDISFLKNTLERLGYNGTIRYVDTLRIARKNLQLENYKQNTIAKYFNIENKLAHRATADAEVCGYILKEFLDLNFVSISNDKSSYFSKITTLDDYERIIFAYIIKMIYDANLDYKYLSAIKNSSGYVDICCYYKFIRFKLAKKGKYIILPSLYLKDITLSGEICNVSEGGNDYVRVYFKGFKDIELLKSIIIDEFKNTYKMVMDHIKNNYLNEQEVNSYVSNMNNLLLADALSIVEEEINFSKLENYLSDFTIKEKVSRSEIKINPKNNRVPLCEIKNLNDWDKGFDAGNKYWIKGDELRKKGNYMEAIEQFDLSRFNGYLAPVLYESYAMAYHQLKDYDNEIEILEEGIDRLNKDGCNTSNLLARRDKAVQILNKEIEKKQIEEQKEQEKIKKEEENHIREEQKRIEIKQKEEDTKLREEKRIRNQSIPSNARIIIQMDDNHNIINTFPTIAEAVRQTGINSKSIRDAANGVQKHAGGYIWEYRKEEK